MRYFLTSFVIVLVTYFPFQEVAGQTAQEQLKQIRSSVIEKIDGRDFYIHTIKRGQTLYMISKAYGVQVNEIIRDNPGVKDGIKADQKLKILVPGQKPPVVQIPIAESEIVVAVKDTAKSIVEIPPNADSVIVVAMPCDKDNTTKKPVYNVALMLPLFLGEVDQIDTENPDPGALQASKSFQFLTYYEGFRLALDSLEKLGIKIRLYVYDADKDTNKTKQLLTKPEMKTMDLIFGLLYHPNFQIVAAFAKANKINLINPISERSELIAENPYVFKVQPSMRFKGEMLLPLITGDFRSGQVLIIRNRLYPDQDAPDKLARECRKFDLSVLVVEDHQKAIEHFSKDKQNFVVAFSDNTAYALTLLRELYKVHNEYKPTLIAMPGWPLMDGLENEYLVGLKTHVMVRSFVDYDDPLVKKFVRYYQESYHSDPERLAFQGYDEAFYFISALNTFGTNIGRCIGEYKMKSIQTRFDMFQNPGDGFENSHWEMFKYENYKLVSIR
ncbi:MAG: LysM peptidoglycan-binding domain-containing protein [Bacteroidales bacterium]|nr:LysM peptidoglycan-binding domain-containing protein [Bacteroidales bacterium]